MLSSCSDGSKAGRTVTAAAKRSKLPQHLNTSVRIVRAAAQRAGWVLHLCCCTHGNNSHAVTEAAAQHRPRQPESPLASQQLYRQAIKVRGRAVAKAAAATAAPQPPALPLARGLSQLTNGAEDLLGWQVLLAESFKLVGTVEQVEPVHVQQQRPAGGRSRSSEARSVISYYRLRVERQAELQPYGHIGREVIVLPLVPAMVCLLHPRERVLIATPPPGLLEMGRRELLLSFLASELLLYAPPEQPPQPGIVRQPLLLTRRMPTRQQLLDAGRQDLVQLVQQVGGFTEVALLLGLRATRRPVGYWDPESLDAELDAFIAGCWVALPVTQEDGDDAEEDQGEPELYYYNTATRAMCWELPPALRTGSSTSRGGGDSGDSGGREAHSALLSMSEGERVLPSASCIRAAGRWDLHHAILHSGGYREAAEMLGRRPAWPAPQPLQDDRTLRRALIAACVAHGWPRDSLPRPALLERAGWGDIAQAVRRRGGWGAAARQLGLQGGNTRHRRSSSSSPATCASVEQTAAALREYMASLQPGAATAAAATAAAAAVASSTAPDEAGAATGGDAQQQQQQQQPQQQHRAHPLDNSSSAGPLRLQHEVQLPTQAELIAAGRRDIASGMQRHGHSAVRAVLGLPPSTRKKLRKGVLRWASVETALLEGCERVRDILDYISKESLPRSPSSSSSGVQAQAPPLVTREHLSRSLSAWVEDGRLERRARGRYRLVHTESRM